MKEIKMTARPWQPQDLLDDLQLMIDEQPDNYLNTDRETLCTAKAYLEEYFSKPKWIPVTEQEEPTENGTYLCHGYWLGSRRKQTETARFFGEWNIANNFILTHWMPLPEPPKGE